MHNRDLAIREEDVIGLKQGNIDISSIFVKEEIGKKLESDESNALSELKLKLLDDESCGYNSR